MPHYTCTVTKEDGSSKSTTVTGKDEASAKRQAERDHPKCTIKDVKLRPVPKKQTAATSVSSSPPKPSSAQAKPPQPPPSAPSPDVATTKPKATPRTSVAALDRLYYLQHGKCFYCGASLDRSDASIDHLHPKSKGGTNVDDNLVVCCKRLNLVFADMGLKEKVRFILNAAGRVVCPTSPKDLPDGSA
jgi:5-methylcytosine-specific restriction endonuclease McrA